MIVVLAKTPHIVLQNVITHLVLCSPDTNTLIHYNDKESSTVSTHRMNRVKYLMLSYHHVPTSED